MDLPGAPGLRERLDLWLDDTPHWWAVALGALAWGAMLPHMTAGVACHQPSWGAELQGWVWMAAAMMLPLRGEAIRWIVARSFPWLRTRLTAAYLLGYLAAWLLVGAAVCALLALPSLRHPWALPAVYAAAALWALSPVQPLLMGRSHEIGPLRPLGWAAHLDCLRLGGVQGMYCFGACAWLMIGCALSGHRAPAMIGGMLLALYERQAWQPRPAITALGCLLLALWAALS